MLWLLMVVPGLVLVVACANVANLLLARGVGRRRELALRRAIGATRGRLVRQLLTESAVLALAGGLFAMIVSSIFIQTIAAIARMPEPMLDALTPDGRVFGLTLVAALLSVFLFGLAPALSATSLRLVPALTDEAGVSDAGGRRRRLRGAFVVTQVAVSMTLLVAAGLFLQSLGRALHVDPGFDPRNVLTLRYDLRLQGYKAPRDAEFNGALLERLQRTPGVQSAAIAAPLPLSGEMYGGQLETDAGPIRVNFSSVSPGYFSTIGLGLVTGRSFSLRDTAGAPGVAVVNETLARMIAPNGDAVGRRLRFREDGEPWRTVVGIARDSHYETLIELEKPFLYLPWVQAPTPTVSLAVRMQGDPKAIVPLVEQAVHELDRNLPLYRVSMLEHNIEGTADLQRAAASLLGVFGALALFLAALGIYGVTSHGVNLRTKEIGIRMALGARMPQVLGLFVSEGVRLSVIGVIAGVILSRAAALLLESFLFGLRATDPATVVVVAVCLCGVAALASYLPARRAAALDPLRALRRE